VPRAARGRRPVVPARGGEQRPDIGVAGLDRLAAVDPDGAGTAGARMVASRISR
jgi:hypothetical protein